VRDAIIFLNEITVSIHLQWPRVTKREYNSGRFRCANVVIKPLQGYGGGVQLL